MSNPVTDTGGNTDAPTMTDTGGNTDAPTMTDTSASTVDVPTVTDTAAPSVDVPTGGDVAAGMVRPAILVSARLVVHGTMSLAWQYDAGATCDTVQINRKKDAGSYAVVQTLTGSAMSAQDSPGHANGNYCYTLTCVLGGMSSAPSNERCVAQ